MAVPRALAPPPRCFPRHSALQCWLQWVRRRNARHASRLGADLAINYHTQDFVEETRKFTGGKGADVVVDIIAGDYVARNYKAAAQKGRIVQIGVQNGPAKELNLMPMLTKRLTHTGSTLRSRSVPEKAQIATGTGTAGLAAAAPGKLKPSIFRVFRLEEAAEAHALMEAGTHIGKIVLTTAAMRTE